MSFTNPITGGQGALIRPAIKSPNYVPGSAGWTINRDGTAEFSNVTIHSSDGSTYSIVLSNGNYQVFNGAGTLVAEITNTGEFNTYGKDSSTNQALFASLRSGSLMVGSDAGGTPGVAAQLDVTWNGSGTVLDTQLLFAHIAGSNAPFISGTSESSPGAADTELELAADTLSVPAAGNTRTSDLIPIAGVQSSIKLVSFTTQTVVSQSVTFAVPFQSAPVVTTNINQTSAVAAFWSSRAVSVTTTGFTLFLYQDRTGTAQTWANVPVSWIATPATQ